MRKTGAAGGLKERLNAIRKERDGAALLISLVILMTLLLLASALLTASYALFSTAVRRKYAAQCRELAVSVSKLLEQQITASEYEEQTQEQFQADLEDGTLAQENPLWYYLRCCLLKDGEGGWQSCEEAADAQETWKTFAVSLQELEGQKSQEMDLQELADYETSVTLYWEKGIQAQETQFPEENASSENFGENRLTLTVQVDVCRGGAESLITSCYQLDVFSFAEEQSDSLSYWEPEYQTTINTQEKWVFHLVSRE